MTLKQWLRHFRQWILTCPVGDPDYVHTFIGRMGSCEKTCIVCDAVSIEEKDEEELEHDKRIQEAFKNVDWESLESDQ